MYGVMVVPTTATASSRTVPSETPGTTRLGVVNEWITSPHAGRATNAAAT